MRATFFAVAAAGLLAAAIPGSSSFAQGVSIEGPGVGVHVGRDGYREHRYRDRERWGDEDRYRYRNRTTTGEGCREVTVRERMPDGSVVTRRRSSC